VVARHDGARAVLRTPANQRIALNCAPVDPKQEPDFGKIQVHAAAELVTARPLGRGSNSQGRPLSREDQQRWGARLGADLTRVCVLSGSDVVIPATPLNPDAVAVRRHVAFGAQASFGHT
jgi:hypothetical protein